MKVTLLSNDDKTGHVSKEQDDKVNESMISTLRTMDLVPFSTKFVSKGNGQRPERGLRFLAFWILLLY
ncbi:hypothetical protein DPMN_151229 [Dreissena polymorpha]|uniref:Uncharacterized protein n=1 Tax=Dreissena polymorpha TaxID=45954 RepID=A0A9D4J424_DREPO|nr:hypothetical protein DPMN_151229 [Dreissena polymorpha]